MMILLKQYRLLRKLYGEGSTLGGHDFPALTQLPQNVGGRLKIAQRNPCWLPYRMFFSQVL